MKKGKLTLFAIPFLALANASLLSACGPKTDYTLTIYNWEDYIYEATDEMGNIIAGEKSTVQAFKDYFEDKRESAGLSYWFRSGVSPRLRGYSACSLYWYTENRLQGG